MDGRPAEPSQYVPQYLLFFAAGQLQPGVPPTPNGTPNLSAPTPRTADGKPDFSGMYGWVTGDNCGAKCTDTQVPREFINIAASVKNPLP